MRELQKISDIVEKGSEIDTLKALRLKLAITIDESKSGRDIAALSKQLREVNEKIKILETDNQDALIEEMILKKQREGRAVRIGSKRADYTE